MRSVLQLVGPSTGGIRRHVAALAADLSDSGWEVSTAAPPGVLEGATRVDVPGGVSPRRLRVARRQFAALVESVRPDVVHAHGLKAGWVAVGVDRSRTVLTVHNVVLDGGVRGLLLRWLERRVVRRSAAVIATSDEIAERLRSSSPSIVTVRPVHEVAARRRSDADVRAEFAAAGPLLVAVGRLHAQKGHDDLLRALPNVLRTSPDAVLVIAGEGPEHAALTELARSLGVAESVRLVGARDDAVDLLGAADVVLVTSRWESGPLTLLEAGCVEAAVVATSVGFVPEIVRSGQSGLIVPIGDPDAIADAIMTLVADPDGRRRLGAALGVAVRPRLDRGDPLRAVIEVYDRVIGVRR